MYMLEYDKLEPFPQWGQEGVNFHALVAFIHGVIEGTTTVFNILQANSSPRFPETLYVVDQQGVWGQVRLFLESDMIKFSVTKKEHSLLITSNSKIASLWPNLQSALKRRGIHYLSHYGDIPRCIGNYLHNGNYSVIPLFTTDAHVVCSHAIPDPT
jgi:hypothetical protein